MQSAAPLNVNLISNCGAVTHDRRFRCAHPARTHHRHRDSSSRPQSRSSAELPLLIRTTHQALSLLGASPKAAEAPSRERGVVSARKSLADPNFIISMIDGKQYTTLKRHLSRYGLTPAEYRQKFGLKADDPMTAPADSQRRSARAKRSGLGTIGRKKAAPRRRVAAERT